MSDAGRDGPRTGPGDEKGSDAAGGPQAEGTRRPARGRPVRRVRPEQTSDDTDAGWGEWSDESAHERWLREQRPPHWE